MDHIINKSTSTKKLWMGLHNISSARVIVYNVPYTLICLSNPNYKGFYIFKPRKVLNFILGTLSSGSCLTTLVDPFVSIMLIMYVLWLGFSGYLLLKIIDPHT